MTDCSNQILTISPIIFFFGMLTMLLIIILVVLMADKDKPWSKEDV